MLEPGGSVGRYRIVGLLGHGGMGEVYEATDPSSERHVAVRVLRPELSDDPSFVARFRREGDALAALDHPHVVPVLEAGQSEHGLFLAMGLVRGVSLEFLLDSRSVNPERALRLLGQVASGLDAVHGAGLVHRDVAPSNVLVDASDHAYLADMGLTRLGDPAGAPELLGRVAYLAPEVIAGQPANPASDRYAFAAVLFECLSGDTVFPRANEAAVLYAHTHEAPPRISGRWLALSTELDPVLEQALAKDPGQRPATASAFVTAAREALGPERISSLGPPPVPRRAPQPEKEPINPAAFAAAARRAAPVGLLAVAAAIIGAVVTLAVVALADDEGGGGGNDAPAAEVRNAPSLGSNLSARGATVDCRGRPPSGSSRACTIAQAGVTVPRNGAIVGWSVRDARGDLALQVLRPRGARLVQVGRSQFESVADGRSHRYPANLAVRRGDRIALVVGTGSAFGLRADRGAVTQRWFPPVTAGGRRNSGPGTSPRGELLLGVDFRADRSRRLPSRLRGSAAANARAGTSVIPRRVLTFSLGRIRRLGLVEVGNRVALDLFRTDRRISRVYVTGLRSGGTLVDLETNSRGLGESHGITLRWVNPSTGRVLEHRLRAGPDGLRYLG